MRVKVKEVGPRDGLQNEPLFIQTEDKIAWINQLSKTGLSYIEVTSFVHPKWIPQLADAYEVASRIERVEGVTYAALVPNRKGLEGALAANMDEVAVFMSASETHNRKNINKSIEETYPVLKEVIDEAKRANKTVRGYVSTVFGCPYEGKVSIERIIAISDRLFELGIDELSLGDTIGVANPIQVQRTLERLLKQFPVEKMALHFHNTYGMALANVFASLQMGMTIFDSSLGGLGGCPYAPGASGNLATDDLVYMLTQMGIDCGVQLEPLTKAAQWIEEKIGRPLTSHHSHVVRGNA
ncbi:hydroxymethylglutaryl-CoA lyase [Anoxybacillus mongoliensis]|uniref:Hydroxymethylglutaryl-CoA lyase n=1 Tax=Anoxybacillus mongoliensis TaxID=452565 RepID=A0A7W8JG67_9BACL|nr:hydroxymethylglutaryl-CoA lyase [Anoxybacillus mongoliensis]MBB5356435.1 hydroxymethylglutaryl-CoA lyase [Anoxybacillus mongoliensis]MCX8002545.1 hydroxymethylglutaryl-CoA lyase [Anoxybacillus mongoliensis]